MNPLTKRRRALMMANMLDITKLIFSYTGNYTDELMTIGGVEYRVLELKSNGTLTIDQKMVDKGITFDVWCVRQGAKGEDGSDSGGTTEVGAVHMNHENYNPTGPNRIHKTKCPDGSNGSNGGWSMVLGSTASTTTYTAGVSSPAYLNGVISVSNTTRSGTAWFTLPSSNNGAGGRGGSGAEDEYCEGCDYSASTPSTPGQSGTPGIVVIRIPIDQ